MGAFMQTSASSSTNTHISRPAIRNLARLVWVIFALLMGYFYFTSISAFAGYVDNATAGVGWQWQPMTDVYEFAPGVSVDVSQTDGVWVVTEVAGDETDGGLQVGDHILPPFPFWTGPRGSTVTLLIQTGDQPPREITFTRDYPADSAPVITQLSDNARAVGLRVGDILTGYYSAVVGTYGERSEVQVFNPGEAVRTVSLERSLPDNTTVYTLTILGVPFALAAVVLVGLTIAVTVTGYGISAFILWKRSDDWVALSVALSQLFVGRLAVSPAINPINAVVLPIMTAIVMATLLIFPNGQLRPRWAIILPLWAFVGESPLNQTIRDLLNVNISAEPIRLFYTIPLILVLVYRYRRMFTQEQRQQAKWLTLGVAIFTVGALLQTLPELIFGSEVSHTARLLDGLGGLVYYLAGIIFPFAILFAIRRYRLWDVDIVINRSLVYGVVGLLAVAIFFIAAFLIQVIFGNQQILIALIFSVIISAALFNPVRNGAQRLVDRYVYGLRFDLNELNRGQQAAHITNPGRLTGIQLGDYQVRGLIGSGGMGEVYEGKGNGQRVAIKTMLPDIAKNPELRTRFEREVEAGQTLQHPNIAQIISSGEHNGTPYLIMEFIDGEELGDVIQQQTKLDDDTALQMMRDICAALHVAHTAGYVHRDIKPGNIMIRADGSAVLMDFGISKAQDARAITGTGAVGTIQYMAPEQIIAAKDVDQRADIYALGVLLYQMLVGETPFSGSPAQVMFAHIQQPAPDPRDKEPDMPESIADAIMKTLQKDPDDRFPDVQAFVTALQ